MEEEGTSRLVRAAVGNCAAARVVLSSVSKENGGVRGAKDKRG